MSKNNIKKKNLKQHKNMVKQCKKPTLRNNIKEHVKKQCQNIRIDTIETKRARMRSLVLRVTEGL